MTQGHILVALFLCGGVFQVGRPAPLGEETPTATDSMADDTPSADDSSDSTAEVDMNTAMVSFKRRIPQLIVFFISFINLMNNDQSLSNLYHAGKTENE